MATATAPQPVATGTEQGEIRLYSHSVILYWWPVWFVGFLMALLTYLDGGRLAVVPPGTEARRDWKLEVAPGRVETREGLILPPADQGGKAHLLPRDVQAAPSPEQPYVRVSSSPYLGTWFFITLLIVFVSANVPLRGLWEWIGVLAIALVVTLFLLYGWWEVLVGWFGLLHIQINLAGYLFLSIWLFAIWAVTVFVFDRRTYITVSAGQVRVHPGIGLGEKVYDVTNLTVQLRPNVLFRHRVLGFFGAGDLMVRTGGPHPEEFEWPNVLFVRSRLKRIEHLLQAREVMPEKFEQ